MSLQIVNRIKNARLVAKPSAITASRFVKIATVVSLVR
ncbi:hypothetical protein JCM19239_2998 [Vibrio variabilis]|uniref:Uncharacterized protein n=1 Tax=Vibrio variabilis TaxID=990271 RepID=A0ABQ0J5F6_9VIBR|nr:hypothetical protein JCM19239_2998 [Vibrio variabilis]